MWMLPRLSFNYTLTVTCLPNSYNPVFIEPALPTPNDT